MDNWGRPDGDPQAHHHWPNERNRAWRNPHNAPGRGLHNAPRQAQQQQRNEGGRQVGRGGQHEYRGGRQHVPYVGGQRDQRPGGRYERGPERYHEQRHGGHNEHGAGRQNEQRGGGRGAPGQNEPRIGNQAAPGGGGHNVPRDGRPHGYGPRAENEQRAADEEGNQRRGNRNQEDREGHRQQPGRPRRDREPEREQQIRRLGYKALEELLQKDPSEVAITLAAHPGLKEMLSAIQMRPDLVELLCKVLCKACTAKLERQSIQHLLGQVKSSSYLHICLPHFIVEMMTETVPERRYRNPANIQNIIILMQEIMSIFPASSLLEMSMLMALIPQSINSLRASGVEVEEQIEQSLDRVSNIIEHLQDRKKEGTLRVDTYMVLGPDAPVEDFRNLSEYPSYDEIHLNTNPFLRPNTLKTKFESTDLYLDTHFRLLREDFVRPLRNGIREILDHHDDQGIRKMKFDDIRVYFDTRIVTPMCEHSGIAYKVQFDVTPLKFVRWQNSKRLLYGSLVCLSQDYFESFLFAIVSNRDEKDLKQGEVQLQFCEQSRELLARASPTDSFIMVETTAYFEAYRHVLEGLKEMNAQDVPFQKYIVSCEKEVGAPRYLNAGSQYNLGCILSLEEETSISAAKNNINVLNLRNWPSKESLGLDESQMQALQLALTKELAIIQGPPGTGKTYVGLKIARALLTNTSVWQLNGHTFPVLVVCYTNHALDQFLEGIHQFLKDGIVRVGARSNSEILKKFNLKELRQNQGGRRNWPLHMRRACGEITQEMKLAEHKLQEGGQLLQCSTEGIIHERFLERHIKEEHWESLHRVMYEDDFYFTTGKKKPSVILEWLGLGSSPFMRTADPAAAAPQENLEELDEVESEEEEMVDIQEEADILQAERVLDDEDEEETARRKRRKAKMVENEMANLLLAMSIKTKEQPGAQENDGEWQTTKKQKKKMKQRIKHELRKADAMMQAEADRIGDIWTLDPNSRWKLYRYWIQLYQLDIRLKILTHEQKYQELADRLAELRQRQDLQLLQQATVIGMTTTGAAKYRRILQEVQPRIVIVEEAAEVLEAHTITTLSSACQHLILIGDHQQLRPSANVYDLAKNFNLEVSMFERLIESGLPFVRLNYQHRMRPEIAQLLTPHIYKELENHPSVLTYENIKGVSSNLFFVKHNFLEKHIHDGKSHENEHEAEFVVELCKYFLHQEYKPSQITILTTYTGQLYCLRKLMPAKTFSGVKVHVVDKYQGEENDIILLSLVRSNNAGNVGFLKIANRICVALSRAKKGLYCIGNMDMLRSVKLWSHIFCTLKQKGQVGDHLMLCCQNHPEMRTLVSSAKHFKDVPEGGCTKKCEFRLNCGHVCTRVCHPYDPEHKQYQCFKDCQKVLCKDGHRCKLKCYELCGECMVEVEKLIPKCNHLQMVPCSISENTFCCTMPCDKYLQCGHPCEKLCGEDCEVRCQKEVTVDLKCGHQQKIKCWQKRDLEFGMPVKCKEPCRTTLNCGHKCSGTCERCFQGRFHEGCSHPCKAVLVCSHECQEPCTRNCPPCSRPCKNRCVHSQCKKECGESCVPCIEPCSWRCQHYRCSRLCSEPCDRPPCSQPCEKQLSCGHQCIGFCGEPCPKKCRECHKDEVTEIFFGFEDEEDACFVQLEDCSHILESSGMDTYMKGQSDSNEDCAIKLKECPKCKTPIRKNLRYGTVINQTLKEIEKVKERVRGLPSQRIETSNRLIRNLEQMVEVRRNFSDEYYKLQETLEDPDTPLRTLISVENLMLFYDKLAKLFGAIKKVDDKEKTGLKNRLQEIMKWMNKTRLIFTEQELSDLQTEVTRFTYLLELLVKCQEAKGRITADILEEINIIRNILENNRKFTEENEIFVKGKLKQLNQKLPKTGLGITESERVMIVNAMELTQGHWFKCPNGHVYCITECGGAMQRSTCPECNSVIGGANHMLESSNRLASEMDGAQHAAWSEMANNMMNFQDLLD
ncbi:NFX1-type zinc finger-containing protein 1 [Hyperolius riggenbachi]|uniref:NFX1-type zinc finger-containing protein 1 n=1 Tax=Hyperolius riggenbachi TaxID=752182 RepID=UPI0035A2A742